MVREPAVPETREHDDNCICDFELDDAELTSDADLPIASGGVALAAGREAASVDADGCDLEFKDAEPTADEDLPVAAGGVG